MQAHEAILLFFMVSIGFLAISYTFTLAVGIPTHIVLNRLSIEHWLPYCLVGLLSPALFQYFMNAKHNTPAQLQDVGYGIYMSCGFLVSLTFWFVSVKPHYKFREVGS